jgi:hypothetical protein
MPSSGATGLWARAGAQIFGEKRARAIARWWEQQDPRYRASLKRLARFRNLHAGKRCFILGNGPSLNQTDLSLLRNEITFATNRIYLIFDRTDYRPSYYVCVNDLVVQQCARDIERLPIPRFIGWHNRDAIAFDNQTCFVHTRGGLRSWFYTDVTEGCWEGSTVTMVALQLAFHMGFAEVILIGVDHSYQFQGKPHEAQHFHGDDPNHFSAGYFKGLHWHLPDLEGSELSYRVADYMYRTHGRRVLDATIGGKLTVFPKVDYYSLFNGRGRVVAAAA